MEAHPAIWIMVGILCSTIGGFLARTLFWFLIERHKAARPTSSSTPNG
jgi:hypothetical protein